MPGLDWAPKGLREIFLQLFTLRGFAAAIQSSVMSSEPTLRELPIAHRVTKKNVDPKTQKELSTFFGDEMDPRWMSDT